MTAPRFRILDIELSERPVRLRIPFRFGVATLTETSQAFARVRIALPGGQEATGMAAELMVPKWFDKDPALSSGQSVDQLRFVLAEARRAYLDPAPRTAFGHSATHHHALKEACAGRGVPHLAAGFGPALLDKAVLDALGRALSLSFADLVRANLPGIAADPELVPDLADSGAGFDLDRFLAGLRPASSIAARHTVGLVDPITADEIGPDEAVADGLPHSLDQVVAAYGHRHFKIKVAGDAKADLDRLRRIAGVLDRIPDPYVATLDGNEQYASVEGIADLWRRMGEDPLLARLVAATAFIEQPVARARTFDEPVHDLATAIPLIIDEADGAFDAFPRACRLGYAGVSSKACKGLYKSLLNAARCARWNAEGMGGGGGRRFFMSAEDLTTQAGLGVQQDLALVGLIGLDHVERNGHHYVDGFGDAPRAEGLAFLAAHPDLYREEAGRVRLAIAEGRIALGSLWGPGFAASTHPDPAALEPLSIPTWPPERD
jgi:hypothetical protein